MEKWFLTMVWMSLLTGCSQTPAPPDPVFAPGSPQEKAAVALTEQVAERHGYRAKKMKLVVKPDADAGNFLIFLLPVDPKDKTLDRSKVLYAIVNAKTNRLIRFSDPKTDRPMKGTY